MYFFNKMLVYLRFFFKHFLWVPFEKTYILDTYHIPHFLVKNKLRYFKPVTSYIVNIKNKLVVYNIYYLTSLAKFQKVFPEPQIELFAGESSNISRRQGAYFKYNYKL